MGISKDQVLKTIAGFYLESSDFNGIPLDSLLHELNSTWDETKGYVQELINDELIGLIFSDTDINTHIIRLGFEPKEIQISKLDKVDVHTCFYPHSNHLNRIVNRDEYRDEPYKLELALGSPQLSHRSFDLSILEVYRNDPRYYYRNDDVNGHISIRDADGSDLMSESDQVLLNTFGFAYDENLDRAVAVYIRYLADLSPEHQRIWKAKELEESYKLHPDYYRNTIIGDWGERLPIFQAFVLELWIINQMVEAMKRPPLFREDYREYGEDRPRKFSFIVRPTLEEFNAFILLLDKMISDNLNKDFFMKEISYENEIERKDGKIIIQQKGTLQLLDEWFRKNFRTSDWEPWDEAINTLKKIRKMRQEPAHSINEDIFDQGYFKRTKRYYHSSL